MQECNLMEVQAQKLNLLFSSYAADSKVESAQLDEGLMGALTGGAIGTGLGALAGGAIKSGADSIKTDELKKSVGAAADNAKNELADATQKAADASKAADAAELAHTNARSDLINNQVDLYNDHGIDTFGRDANGNIKITADRKLLNNLEVKRLINQVVNADTAERTADALASNTATARIVANDKLQQAKKAAEWTNGFDPNNGNFDIDNSGNITGLSINAPKIKASNLAKAADFTSKNSTAIGATAGGVTGAAVGHLATSKNKDKKNVTEDEDNNIIAAESMKVYEMFRAAVDEEEKASNAKKAGYSATGAFLGTAVGGPVGAAIGGATGAAMTNTDSEQKSQQLGKAIGAGVGGAAGAALTGGSLAGTTIGAAAGAMLGDTVGKMAGNKHSKPTPVRNRKKPSKPKP